MGDADPASSAATDIQLISRHGPIGLVFVHPASACKGRVWLALLTALLLSVRLVLDASVEGAESLHDAQYWPLRSPVRLHLGVVRSSGVQPRQQAANDRCLAQSQRDERRASDQDFLTGAAGIRVK